MEETAPPSGSPLVLTSAGDICGRTLPDGSVEDIDPDDWGWASPGHFLSEERRSTIEQLEELPGFTVTTKAGTAFVPGPKRRGGRWLEWPVGHAPPAGYLSSKGVVGYYSRRSEVLGYVAWSLPQNPGSSPYFVHDFVKGEIIEVSYVPPDVGPGGEGVVYVLDDGFALKIGHTTQAPALRVNGLQTGNPRLLRTLATIPSVSADVEAHLHRRLAKWTVRGEWFERDPILAEVEEYGGWEQYLRSLLPGGGWEIMPSLEGRWFGDVSADRLGDVGEGTRFGYHEEPDGTVWARYAGGSVRLGFLVGTRTGDELKFRYAHLTVDGATATGHCASIIELLDDGRLRLHETWEWDSRPGHGTSTLEELEMTDVAGGPPP